MNDFFNINEINGVLIHQLNNLWINVDTKTITSYVPDVMVEMERNFKDIKSEGFYRDGKIFFNPLMTTHWSIFLYRLSHMLYQNEKSDSADYVYYLNKVLHSVDWFYAIDLPIRFMCEHPIGSVLGRAVYGEQLFVYQGTTVGGNRKDGELYYPRMGNRIIMFSNASVIGKSNIGNNVVVSTGTTIVNDYVPSNSIVFGKSPHLVIKRKNEDEIIKMIDEYW